MAGLEPHEIRGSSGISRAGLVFQASAVYCAVPMASSRLKSLSKLALLLGVPVALLFALFSGGVYYGVAKRDAILRFEHDWLGMDVVVPTPKVEPPPVTTSPEAPKLDPVDPVAPVAPVTPVTPVTPVVMPVTPTPVVAPVTTPAALVAVTEPLPLTLGAPLPLADDLRARLAEPVRVRVKVLVDPELVDRRPDWIAYVQRHIAWASQVLEAQVGVRLELRGVVVWPGTAGASAEAQREDLRARSRDGADLLLGLSNHRFASAPFVTPPGDANAAQAIVWANPSSRAPHLRGLLFAVGQSLGAVAVADPSSFMGDVLAADSAPLSLDADSRRRMLERKSLPFQAGPEPRPSLDQGEL